MSDTPPVLKLDRTCAGLLPELPGAEGRPVLRHADDGRWLTVAELRQQALALAKTLQTDRKKLIFLLASNSASCVVGLLGTVAAGHAVALIDAALAPEKLAQLLEAYRPDILLSSEPFPAKSEIAENGERLEVFSGNGLMPHVAFFDHVPGGRGDIHPDLLLLLSTSGTTGSVKFVRLSRDAVLTNARQIVASLDIGAKSVGVAHLPLHYSYGLSVVTSHLLAGARIALIDGEGVTSATFWEQVAAAGGTHFPGVPFHYTVLARLGFAPVPETVTTFTQAGGPLDRRMLDMVLGKTAERNARFFVMYGQTEAAPRMTTLPSGRALEKAGSVGQALPGGRLIITGADGIPLPAGQIGNVVYEGQNVMMGYAQGRPDLDLGDVMGRRLETGDVGFLDADGFLFLSGRKTRFAKIAGLRLGLDEIEAEVAAVGVVACLDRTDKILVFYEGDIGVALKTRLKTLAAAYKIPAASFVPRPAAIMPRKASGKIDYAKLTEIAADV